MKSAKVSLPLLTLVFLALALATPAWAAGGGPDLEVTDMLQSVLDWLTGSVATIVGGIAMAAAAFTWMFLRHERGADFAFRALLGTAIAIGAANIIDELVGQGALL